MSSAPVASAIKKLVQSRLAESFPAWANSFEKGKLTSALHPADRRKAERGRGSDRLAIQVLV